MERLARLVKAWPDTVRLGWATQATGDGASAPFPFVDPVIRIDLLIRLESARHHLDMAVLEADQLRVDGKMHSTEDELVRKIRHAAVLLLQCCRTLEASNDSEGEAGP